MRRNMDESLRRAERDAASGGHESRLFVARMRAGSLDPEQVELAAVLGDEIARIAAPEWRASIRPAWANELRVDPQVELRTDHVSYAASLLKFAITGGPEIARAIYDRSIERSAPRTPGTASPEWIDTLERATALVNVREEFGSGFGALRNLASLSFETQADQDEAWGRELEAQRADLIALLLGRSLTPIVRGNADEGLRRAERDAARTGAHDDLARDLVARMRAGLVDDDALQRLARIGYVPAQELAGHGRSLRAGPNRDKLLTDPVERAFETLGEVAELADGTPRILLWPLGAAAMLLSAERSVVSQRIRSRRTRLETALRSARETVEDALAVARGGMPQVRGDPPETTRPVDSVWSLMQASAALRRSLRPHGHRSDINEVAYNAVNACGRMSPGYPQVAWSLAGRMGFTVDAQNAVHVARAVTKAVVPAILAGDVMASPLLSRSLPWQTQANRPRRRNTDDRLRVLERQAESTGATSDAAAFASERRRAGIGANAILDRLLGEHLLQASFNRQGNVAGKAVRQRSLRGLVTSMRRALALTSDGAFGLFHYVFGELGLMPMVRDGIWVTIAHGRQPYRPGVDPVSAFQDRWPEMVTDEVDDEEPLVAWARTLADDRVRVLKVELSGYVDLLNRRLKADSMDVS